MAKARRAPRPDEPNLVLPLATSYNERGVAGYTHSVTNSEDQRKLNCIYEVAKNPLTGKGTLVLAKRQGVTINANTYGSASDVPMLISRGVETGAIAPLGVRPWVFSCNGLDVKVSNNTTTTTIFSDAAGFTPLHVDATVIYTALDGAPTVVLQSKTISDFLAQRVFYGTAIGTWTEITDADFTSRIHRGKMEHLDGYAFYLDAENLIWNSDLNSLSSWLATSFFAKQIKQDYSVGLARLGNQILAFGDYTMEAFFNAGNTTGSPLGRIATRHEETGLIRPYTAAIQSGTHYYAILGKTLFFVGRRAGGVGSVGLFAYSGDAIENVGTSYINKIIGEKVAGNSYFSINTVSVNGENAIAVCLTAPTAATQRSLMFFPKWKEWFEWTSTVFQPVNNGANFLGLGTSGNKVYEFANADNWQDNGVSYAWSTQFRLPTNGSSRRFMSMYGIDGDTDTSTNDLTAEISTNDCVSFSTLGTIDQTQDRKLLFRGGAFRKAHIRLGNTNARPTRIHNFLARID